jgi:hypothetical protein
MTVGKVPLSLALGFVVMLLLHMSESFEPTLQPADLIGSKQCESAIMRGASRKQSCKQRRGVHFHEMRNSFGRKTLWRVAPHA